MNLLIVGSGMYVTGRNGTGTGTILSSLAQSSKTINIDEVVVVSRSKKSSEAVSESVNNINNLLQSSLKVTFQELEDESLSVITKLHKKYNFTACIISIPDHLHFMYGEICLNLSIPTLMVKPLTPTVDEAKKLIDISDKNNAFACVEFHKRYDETNLWIKKAIAENKLGKLNYITVDYSQRINIPLKTFKGWSSESNIFQYLGVHYVDLIYFLTGFIPKRASAYGVYGILKEHNIFTYDSVHAMIEWANPEDSNNIFLSNFNTNWIDPNNSSALSDQKYKVIGTLGRIECDQKNRGVELVTEKTGIQQINPYFSDYLPDEDGNLRFGGYGHNSIQLFLKDILSLKEGKTLLDHLNICRPSFKDSLTSVAVIEAVNKSMSKNSQWIDIQL